MVHYDYAVPIMVQSLLANRVQQFNQERLSTSHFHYVDVVRGKFIYLHLVHITGPEIKVGRLRYEGNLTTMTFSPFKQRSNKYDAKATLPSGAKHLDGTIEGAMRAGFEAYLP